MSKNIMNKNLHDSTNYEVNLTIYALSHLTAIYVFHSVLYHQIGHRMYGVTVFISYLHCMAEIYGSH